MYLVDNTCQTTMLCIMTSKQYTYTCIVCFPLHVSIRNYKLWLLSIEVGVAQDSVFGPLLFILFLVILWILNKTSFSFYVQQLLVMISDFRFNDTTTTVNNGKVYKKIINASALSYRSMSRELALVKHYI